MITDVLNIILYCIRDNIFGNRYVFRGLRLHKQSTCGRMGYYFNVQPLSIFGRTIRKSYRYYTVVNAMVLGLVPTAYYNM